MSTQAKMKMLRRRPVLLVLMGSLMSVGFVYRTYSSLVFFIDYRNYAVTAALDRASETQKTILYWHPPGELRRTKNLTLPKECGSCKVTADMELINGNHTAAVIFLYDYVKSQYMKRIQNRNPEQIWIWWNREAPPYLKFAKLAELDLADKYGFNLTMTTRKDSDIVVTYDNMNAFSSNLTDNFEDLLKQKKHIALAAVSNCGLTQAAKVRLQYLKLLIAKRFKLDARGKCFSKRISKTSDELNRLTSNYKFYFAFENAYHCNGYVTEKFFRGLRAGAVPVVWGATKEEYELHAPPGSFIFVDDFPSMSALMKYLNYLDQNDEAYLKYFEWRKTKYHQILPKYRENDELCQICRKIHGIQDVYTNNFNEVISSIYDGGVFHKSIHSVRKWYMDTNNEDCLKNLTLDVMGRIKIVRKVTNRTEFLV